MNTSICLLALIVCAGISTAAHHDELLQIYGCKKIFESCFGKTLMEQKMREFKGHCDICKAGGSSSVAVVRKAFDWNAVFQQQTGGQGPIFLPIPVAQNQSPFFTRQKRDQHTSQAYFNEAKLRELKNTFVGKMKIVSCVLQRLSILDANMNIQWNEVRNMYNKLNVEPALKADLLEVNTKCQQLVTCLPYNQQMLGTFPLGLKQAFMYFKCEKKKKIEACMKKDLRQKADMFELQGLDGLLDHIEGEDDKMLRVLKLHTKFGDDDFGMFG